VALVSGPVLAFTGLVCLTLAVQPVLLLLAASALLMGLGIGIYNVHLVARLMSCAAPEEQRSLASALTSVRSLGTAVGAAFAGVVASTAGLGTATEPVAVGHAVTAVYLFCWIPFSLAAVFMVRFTRLALPPGSTRLALAD
jgi:predicted MFS family arabinose efflux permease